MSETFTSEGTSNAGGIREVTVRVLIVGPHGVGKTTLTSRISKGRFERTMRATIGVDFAAKAWLYRGHPSGTVRIKAQFTDVMGQDRGPQIPRALSRVSQGFIAVTSFPVKDESMRALAAWIKTVQLEDPELEGYVVCNKSDLATGDERKSSELMLRDFFLPSTRVEGGATTSREFDPDHIAGVAWCSAMTGDNLPGAITEFVEGIVDRLPASDFDTPNLPSYSAPNKLTTVRKRKQRRTCC